MAKTNIFAIGGSSGLEKTMAVTGDAGLMVAMFSLKQSSSRMIMRPAIRKGMTIANKAAKRNVGKRSGRLKKSIGVKVGKSKEGGVSAKLYIRPGFEGTENGKEVDPQKYAHLVEFGTRHSKANPFMRSALGDNKETIRGTIRVTAWENLKKATAKARAQGKAL